MHFNYWLTGTGWAEVTFANEKHNITFQISYLSNPLSDLLEALYRLLQKETALEIVVFTDEPGERVLILTTVDERNVKIDIYWSDKWEETVMVSTSVTNKNLVYEDTDTLENFIKTVFIGINELLGRTTIREYKKQWGSEFPENSFNKLKLLVEEVG